MGYKIDISGVVQGVGFRPFIYNLCSKLGINGSVENRGGDVRIIAENVKNISEFIGTIRLNAPIHAKINNIKYNRIKTQNTATFVILDSLDTAKSLDSPLGVDLAICKECLKDMRQDGRFYKYAFSTCTNCGPRYSIIKSLPYDRANTSMSKFTMCQKCQSEYDDPANRRFHAQPTSCKDCAIKIWLIKDQNKIELKDMSLLVKYLKNGDILAIKGVGGYNLVCDALNLESIKRLRQAKNRPDKPFAIMCKDIQAALKFASINPKEKQALSSMKAPIVLLNKKKNLSANINDALDLIAPNISTIGIVLAYNGIMHEIFAHISFPLIFTSANISGEPISRTLEEVSRLEHIYKCVLEYDREILNSIDDSVLRYMAKDMRIIRLARGYAPLGISLPCPISKDVLGFGASQKSTIAIASHSSVIVSPYIGDLGTSLCNSRFITNIELFRHIYDKSPNMLICDKHEGYDSTKMCKEMAQNNRIKMHQIYHHRAHFYSIMGEYFNEIDCFKDTHLGFIFDGTGLGEDGNIWGGEVFSGNLKDMKHLYSFAPLKLIGKDSVSKDISRLGYALIYRECGESRAREMYAHLGEDRLDMYAQMIQKNLNVIDSSSVGRLFDAVASILGILPYQSYEAQSGALIESCALKSKSKAFYRFKIDDKIQIDYLSLLNQKDKIDLVCKKFINTLAEIVLHIALSQNKKISFFSGGVFNNKLLCDTIQSKFIQHNLKAIFHKILPCGDYGISYGQIVAFATKSSL